MAKHGPVFPLQSRSCKICGSSGRCCFFLPFMQKMTATIAASTSSIRRTRNYSNRSPALSSTSAAFGLQLRAWFWVLEHTHDLMGDWARLRTLVFADAEAFKLPPPASSRRAFGEVARVRRSALEFLGELQSMSLTQLSAILAATTRPFFADFGSAHFIQLYLYAHRVDGLQPGPAQPAAQQHGDDGAVAQALQRCDIRRVQQRLRL